jgi:hypothetical protein
MTQRLLALLVTLLVVAAGFGAGVIYERQRPVPPPPGFFLGEFGGGTRPGQAGGPINRAQLAAELSRLGPDIETFRARAMEIDAEFDRDLELMLTPEQRVSHDEWLKRREADRQGSRSAAESSAPLTDDQIAQLLQRPMHALLATIVLPMRLDQLNHDLKFDPVQRAKVRDLLRVRREKFLELIDSSPPPSVMLSRLAPMAQRLGRGAPPPAKQH